MLEVRPICTCTKCEPLKEVETEIPSFEFVAEFIQVKLQESILYVVVCVKNAPFGIAYRNVYPWEHFSNKAFIFHYECLKLCNDVVINKVGIGTGSICCCNSFIVNGILYRILFGIGLQIGYGNHFYVPYTFARTMRLLYWISWDRTFCHYEDSCLLLASTSSLKRYIFLSHQVLL